MSLSKGFSIIETLVAVALASIVSLSLLGVASNTSKTSKNVIERFDSSMMMGVMAGIISERMHNHTVRLDETLRNRYQIDNDDILDSLEGYTYDIRHTGKEYVDPLMLSDFEGVASAPNALTVETMILYGSNDRRTVYGITRGIQE